MFEYDTKIMAIQIDLGLPQTHPRIRSYLGWTHSRNGSNEPLAFIASSTPELSQHTERSSFSCDAYGNSLHAIERKICN